MFTTRDTIFEKLGALCAVSGPDRAVSALTLDSRQAQEGCGFIALKGEHRDGYDFVASALEAHAPLIIMERMPDAALVEQAQKSQATIYVAQQAVTFIQQLAHAYRKTLQVRCVGITGSVGKTTTKEMVKAVCEACYKTHATAGNFNNDLGLPLTILSAPEDTEVLILEMGMSALGEIDALARIGLPEIGVVTNVGLSHLESLKTQDNIARAKGELFENLVGDHPRAVFEATGQYAPYFIDIISRNPQVACCTYALKEALDAQADADKTGSHTQITSPPLHETSALQPELIATDISVDDEGKASFTAESSDGSCVEIHLGIPGVHNVSNALSALCVARLLKIESALAVQALSWAATQTAGRQNVIKTKTLTLIDDAYNASPQSVNAALKSMMSMKVSGRRVAVLGDMLELGESERELHESVGLQVAACGIDVLVTVGQRAQAIAQKAQESDIKPSSIISCGTAQDALEYVRTILAPGDLVLVKASHSMGLDTVVKGLSDLDR